MGYIFEAEIETIKNTVRARTIGEADSIELRKILGSDVHPAIKSYFKNEVEKLLQQERLQEKRSKRFPYTAPEVLSLQRQIDLLLISRYPFDQAEFESLLDHSVHFQFNYLCRPQWTLLNFVFEQKRHVPSAEILRKLRYCADYMYFPKILSRYISEHGLAEVSYEQFKDLISKIDSEITAHYNGDELAKMLQAMVAFIVAGTPTTESVTPGSTLPVNAAVVFFEDKGMLDVKSKLEHERDRNKVDQVTIERLSEIMKKVRGEDKGVEEPVAQQKMEIHAAGAHHEQRPVPSVQSLQSEKSHKKESTVGDPADLATEPRPSKVMKTSDKGERRKSRVLEDIYSLFSVPDQKLFVKKLFHKDEVEFRDTLDRLNKISDWKEASLAIDQIFVTNDIDPFSKAAIKFTEKLYGRYLPLGTENRP